MSCLLPQTAVSEESEARESESWGGASALRFPVTANYHNLSGITVNNREGQRQRNVSARDMRMKDQPQGPHGDFILEEKIRASVGLGTIFLGAGTGCSRCCSENVLVKASTFKVSHPMGGQRTG